jgi:hypothetical protein
MDNYYSCDFCLLQRAPIIIFLMNYLSSRHVVLSGEIHHVVYCPGVF